MVKEDGGSKWGRGRGRGGLGCGVFWVGCWVEEMGMGWKRRKVGLEGRCGRVVTVSAEVFLGRWSELPLLLLLLFPWLCAVYSAFL